MAGSYNAVVDEQGRLLQPEDICSMLECHSGDVAEAVEEMYGMIWWLAEQYARSLEQAQGEREGVHHTSDMVEEACQRYREGIEISSPGRRSEDEPLEDEE